MRNAMPARTSFLWAASGYERYCDGTSFTGDRDAAVMVTGSDNSTTAPVYFRGRRIVDAVLATLLEEYDFGSASENAKRSTPTRHLNAQRSTYTALECTAVHRDVCA